ncbi:ImmA/IrrE family metallo-endopeptidase [Nocardioides sp. cx-173]|uniref:ImmA/IrrE family metallo-endopeptidase n=1 Tax=Nocardioides sp. cx-173 TaxID=2898796 RepID=UPI001E3BF475|nr:ImmA/IrrE family metallo-endopeptidase [Nocardioides sp. cx-173]MCD4523348.1 ImmA/IrrE family metallo-endopeptidase [Nocardioides sp. cx-173]UGB42312.1 ImmA/IrrE family metallo-endopeptidase [Nocardioides sp. cx-173]
MTDRWHPWRAVARHPDVTVVYDDPGEGNVGLVDLRTRVITLCPSLLQDERRSTLTHELVHLERGTPCGPGDPEEREVERLAARRIITLPDLVEAVRWSDHLVEQAVELWADEDMVRIRLHHLTAAEREELTRVRASCEGLEEPARAYPQEP